MRCITANVLQTKVDAQCDKLVTELSWQFLPWSTFLSYSELIKLPILTYHLHLAPPLGATPFEFCWDLWDQKSRVPGLSCGTVYVIICLAVSVEHRLVTDRQTTMAYTALVQRHMAKKPSTKTVPALAPLTLIKLHFISHTTTTTTTSIQRPFPGQPG